jgi:YVTN family beta-propeller protein
VARKKNLARNASRTKRLNPLAGLVALGVASSAMGAGSEPFPTYVPGPQKNSSYIVASGQVLTPAGKQVNLGEARAKSVALHPTLPLAAVLTMSNWSGNPAPATVQVFNTTTGAVVQTYTPPASPSGSFQGIAFSADGTKLMFSQDEEPTYTTSYIAVADVDKAGHLTNYAEVSVPPTNKFITCFPNSPLGNYAAPCGVFYTGYSSNPSGVAFSANGKSAYAILNANNTLAQIDLTSKTQGTQIRVGNAPHSILIDGNTAYISNEGGRVAKESDFTIYSDGTEIVADQVNGSSVTGTVSVVDLNTFKLVNTIEKGIGLHPTGMAKYGKGILVANANSDTLSLINTDTQRVARTIDLGLPIKIPGEHTAAYGAAPDAIAVDEDAGIAYVALYKANAIAVVKLQDCRYEQWDPAPHETVVGLIPVAYAPSSVVFDKRNHQLIVANDKGIGTTVAGFPEEFLFSGDATGYPSLVNPGDALATGNWSHAEQGTVSLVPIPDDKTLLSMTSEVYRNNHWDLIQNIESASGGNPQQKAAALPAKIGDPSLIKHVFLIIRENRTYDQILGDVSKANGDSALAMFSQDHTNDHAIVSRFPLFDNFYNPSRQSSDGHQWITQAMSDYNNDVGGPDWVRSYPGGNAGDSLAYLTKGFFFQEAVEAGLPVKIYGEYVENTSYDNAPGGTEPSWTQFYNDSLNFQKQLYKESGQAHEHGTTKSGNFTPLTYQNAALTSSSLPVVENHLITNFPPFDLGIPDQFRVDIWDQDFQNDVKNGTVPALTILWIMCDHTGGPPDIDAEQADNDLAIGRIVDYVSHSKVWDSSAIFIEEDDAQTGLDHVDGHRSPGFIVSPYVWQDGRVDHTFYTQVNMTRTIEQILGLKPLNQNDLVASPMATAFVTGTPPQGNFAPFSYVSETIALNKGVPASTAALRPVEREWLKARKQIFAGKFQKPDSEDSDVVGHMNWYFATNFSKPYPGERKVRMPKDFPNLLVTHDEDDDEDKAGD